MKKTMSILCLCALLLSTCLFTACNIPTPDDELDPTAASFVSVDINPEVELTLNAENEVVSVYAANEDAQVLLYGELDLTGMDVDAAIETLIDLAVEQGYLSEDNHVVETSVVGEDEDATQALMSRIEAKITSQGEKLGLHVKCDSKGAYSLLRRLEAFKEQYPDSELIANLSVAEFKLALSASETGEVTLEAAVTMDKQELMNIIRDAHVNVEKLETDAYKKATEEANKIYKEALDAAQDDLYTQYFLQNPLKHYNKLHYGPVYQMYRYAARALYAMADVMDTTQAVYTQALTEEQIAAVSAALGLSEEDLDLIKNEDGEITVESVESYADILFKNAEESEDYTEVKKALTEALTSCESQIHNMLRRAHCPKVELTIEGIEGYITALNTQLSMMPAAQEGLSEFISDVEVIIAELKTLAESEEVTSDAIRAAADALDAKAKEMLKKIETAIGEEGKAEIEGKRKEKEDALSHMREDLEEAYAQAKKEAEDRISGLKEEREQHHGHGGGKH